MHVPPAHFHCTQAALDECHASSRRIRGTNSGSACSIHAVPPRRPPHRTKPAGARSRRDQTPTQPRDITCPIAKTYRISLRQPSNARFVSLTLITLCNGLKTKGLGGTQHMRAIAQKCGTALELLIRSLADSVHRPWICDSTAIYAVQRAPLPEKLIRPRPEGRSAARSLDHLRSLV